jgi:hypothetical protein
MDAPVLEIRVLDGVHVDSLSVGVHRPTPRPRPDDVPAVERGRVVGRERAFVVAVVGVDRPQAADRKTRRVEMREDADERRYRVLVRDERTAVRAAVEAPIRDPQAPKLRRQHGTASVP